MHSFGTMNGVLGADMGNGAPAAAPDASEWNEALIAATTAPNLITRWLQQQSAEQRVNLSSWVPQVGEMVGRGPGWRFGAQGKHADYGIVVATHGSEVLVRWIPSADAPKSARAAPVQLFRYAYTFPCFEVVSWENYLRVKTTRVANEYILLMEFVWACAVAGVLCQQLETVQYVLQFEITQAMVRVLDRTDIATSHFRVETTTEEAEMRAQQQLEQLRRRLGAESAAIRSKTEEEWIQTFLQWDGEYLEAKTKFRMDRECITRAGWALNALLGHKKLAFLFLENNGMQPLMRICLGPLEVSTTYGCAIILSRLARHAVFEEVLRKYDTYFEPIMSFILSLWLHRRQNDIQASAGAFLFHSLGFPCVLRFFDREDGGCKTADILNEALTSSEEKHDVVLSNLQLIALRCLNTYLISHVLIATNVIFRQHRIISTLVRNASPYVSLPRDAVQIQTILGHLTAPTPTLPDVTLDNVQSCLTLECLSGVRKLLEHGFLRLLLRAVKFYYVQSRWELLIAALQALHVLTVIPQTRPLLLESRGPELSGMAQLLLIISDLSASLKKIEHKSSAREGHIIPCLVTALHTLLHVMTPPPPTDTAAAEDASVSIAFFNSACAHFRAHDGVYTMMEVLLNKKESSFSSKLKYFPVVARAVQLMVLLRRYGDTSHLFEALGVHDVAHSLGQQYLLVQRKLTPDGSPSDHDPSNRFMENLQILKKRSFDDAASPVLSTLFGPAGGGAASVVGGSSLDAMHMDQRQAIVARAAVDYDKDSLLELISRHLEAEGLSESARVLRREGGLSLRHPPPPPSHPTHMHSSSPLLSNSNGNASVGNTNSTTTNSSTGAAPTLDGIIRVYLRQQQANCTNPIETLPPFQLTGNHVFQPLPPPADTTRGVLSRILHRKIGGGYTKQMSIYDTCFTYNNPSFLFDVTGVGEGLLGESICFADNGNALAIGTSEGGLTLFDTYVDGPDDKVMEQHMVFDNQGIIAVNASPSGGIVTAIREDNHAVLMRRDALPVAFVELENCEAVRVSHDERYALCTFENKSCHVMDLTTKTVLRVLNENALANNTTDRNFAIFDAASRLVLHDAVLWDWRCSNAAIFRFDRFSEMFAAMFHPNNHQVIIDERVWDLRTRGILHTVPTFHRTTSFHASNAGRAIYSFRERTEAMDSVVSAVDSLSYEIIFSGEVHPTFKAFCVDPSDRYCAAILDHDVEAVIRVFSASSGFDRCAFAAPNAPDEREEIEESDGEEEDWSIGSSADDEESTVDYSSGDEEEDEEEEDEDTSATTAQGEGPSVGGGSARGGDEEAPWLTLDDEEEEAEDYEVDEEDFEEEEFPLESGATSVQYQDENEEEEEDEHSSSTSHGETHQPELGFLPSHERNVASRKRPRSDHGNDYVPSDPDT